jgi:Zn-finger nucleic acid-binding protein
MITLELAQVEIDYCVACHGIWLDAGELEMLLGDAAKAKKLIGSFQVDAKSAEKPRKCPICDKKMEKVIVGHDKPVLLIDRCAKGDGLWFDEGELQDITARAKLDPDNKIQKLLANMFDASRPEHGD